MCIALKCALRGYGDLDKRRGQAQPIPRPQRQYEDRSVLGMQQYRGRMDNTSAIPVGGILRVHPKCAGQPQGALPIWCRGRQLLPVWRLWAAERDFGEADESDRPERYGSAGCLRSCARRESFQLHSGVTYPSDHDARDPIRTNVSRAALAIVSARGEIWEWRPDGLAQTIVSFKATQRRVPAVIDPGKRVPRRPAAGARESREGRRNCPRGRC